MHVLPQLRELEERFRDELVVIGVHSGKFITERETDRIAAAAERLGVAHPVVNDRQFRVWRSYAVRAWPSIVVIDPRGYVLGQHAGEFTAAMVAPTLEEIIAAAGDALERGERFPASDAPPAGPGTLRFPGKVAVEGARIAIADSGNHRVIVGTLTSRAAARVDRTFGSMRGNRDGADPLFDNPQGLLFDGDTILVADAGNHTVRALDLATGATRTIAGTGRQLRTRADLAAGALSSPWDLAFAGDRIAIAMAGNHRLYMLDRGGTARPFAGSGAEEITDGPLLEAALAQPMGICAHGEHLYFADSETSAIRRADVREGGRVETLVGTGLFDFGDVDGVGTAVRLQHAQAVARAADGRLLVADSYNDALKWLDPATREVKTWVRGLHEPTGLAFGDGVVYVADSDAHRVAVIDEGTRLLTRLELDFDGLSTNR
ncbi:MAG TPA: thioredoxin-like domain-containing protein [Gemmatimonadaceae bacterium]|nr:thioredoxin-like domain-containing protein [Gemmatimonadaceae bacterium]